MIDPTSDGEQAGERDPRRRVPGRRQRDDRRGDERSDRRVGSQDEDPRRAQQEVHDKRHERRVEPSDRRHARELGVRHALRDEQCGEDDARDDVAAQVGAADASQQHKPRRPTTEPVRAFHERDTNEAALLAGHPRTPSLQPARDANQLIGRTRLLGTLPVVSRDWHRNRNA